MTSWAKDRVDLEVIGLDSAIFHKWWTASGWSSFERLGGTFRNDSQCAVSFPDRRLHLFGFGSDSALWHKYYDGSGGWQPAGLDWTSLKGVCMNGPTACEFGDDNVACFVVGTDRHCWVNTVKGNSAGQWTDIGGRIVGDSLTACSWGPGRIDVFARGMKNELIHNFYANGKWTYTGNGMWEDLGGTSLDKPKVVSARDNRLDIFTKGMDSYMFHRCYNGTWQDWQRIGTAKHLYSPDAVCWDRNRIDVFSVGPDSQLIHVYANIPNNERGDFHGDWEKLAVSCSGPPKALSRAPNILDVFVKGFKQQVQQKAWNGSSWNPTGTGLYDLGGVTASAYIV